GEDPLERHQQSLDSAGSQASLDVRGRDRLEAPALTGMLVEDPLQVVAGHLAADHLLPELQDLVLEPFGHQPMVAAAADRSIRGSPTACPRYRSRRCLPTVAGVPVPPTGPTLWET